MKKLIALLCALSMMLSLAACGSSGSSSDESTSSGNSESTTAAEETAEEGDSDEPETLTVGTVDSADTFDPCSNSNCRMSVMLVYDTILKLDYETQEVQPCLATDWEWLDDTTLQLTIREGVYFSNGDEMTPSDVLYSLSRFVYENDQFDPGYDNIDFDACTIEGNILTLYLYEIDADFLSSLANDLWASVVNESYVTENPDAWWDAPCGTGPYTCDANVEGSYSQFTRRDDYWGDLPDAETVIIRYYSESTTMIADFENGDLDIAIKVSETDYLAAAAGTYGDDVVAVTFPSYDVLTINLPYYNEIFDDIRVRQAIAMAIDYEALTYAVYGSLGTVADSYIIEGVEYYYGVGTYDYDPEAAIALLEEAGYGDGLDMLLVIPSTTQNDAAAVVIQEYLRAIGINLEVQSYDFATAIPILMANGTDIGLGGTGGGTYLASTIMDTISMYNTNGASSISDLEFNGYLDTALATLDSSVREENYKLAQQWLYDNIRCIPIAWCYDADLYHSNISGVEGLTARDLNLVAVTIN